MTQRPAARLSPPQHISLVLQNPLVYHRLYLLVPLPSHLDGSPFSGRL